MRRWIIVAAATAALLALGTTAYVAARPGPPARPDPLAGVRSATAKFNSTVQAKKAGYAPFPADVPLHDCIMAGDGSGGMGFHWVNGDLLDAALDPLAPEVLVYAPKRNGKLELVALEYVVFADAWSEAHGSEIPTIPGLDQPLRLVTAPNRYEIPAFWQRHVWLYEPNETGTYADFNPAVTCDQG